MIKRHAASACMAVASAFALAVALAVALAIWPSAAAAASATMPDGATLPVLWAVPFAGVLASIAIFPLVAPVFWHHHFGKIAAAVLENSQHSILFVSS